MRFAPIVFVVALALGGTVLHAGQVPLNVVAVSGQNAPGGGKFVSFQPIVVDHLGRTYFHAQTDEIHPVRDTLIEGAFFSDSSEIRVLARPGMQAPGNDQRYHSVSSPLANGAGQFLFEAFLGQEAEPTGQALVLGEPDRFSQIIARTGDRAPGTDTTFNFLDVGHGHVRLASGGQTVFTAVLDQIENPTRIGIWAANRDGVQYVARAGDRAPGTPDGVVYNISLSHDEFSFGRPHLNGAGQVAFRSFLSGVGVNLINDAGIWAGSPGHLQLVARTMDADDISPDEGVAFTGFGDPAMLDSGEIGFHAHISGLSSVWKGPLQAPRMLAQSGTAAPGGGVFGAMKPTFSTLGRVAFHADLAELPDPAPRQGHVGIFVDEDDGEGFRLVARTGQIAPGTAEPFTSLSPPAVNNAGQVVFLAFQGDPAGIGQNGIWATDPQGNLLLIARSGDVVDLGDGVSRTIFGTGINLSFFNQPGGFSPINDFGQITFGVTFTDGTSAILTASVPESGGCCILLGAIAMMLITKRPAANMSPRTHNT